MLFHGPTSAAFHDQFADFFEASGGIRHHVLTHAPEASKCCSLMAERWGTRTWLPARDRSYLRGGERSLVTSDVPTSGRWITNVKVVPLPGHTPGFTGYLVKRPSATFLMIGDFLALGSGARPSWRAAVGHRLMKEPALASLDVLGTLRFAGFLPNKGHDLQPIPWPVDGRDRMVEQAASFVRKKFL